MLLAHSSSQHIDFLASQQGVVIKLDLSIFNRHNSILQIKSSQHLMTAVGQRCFSLAVDCVEVRWFSRVRAPQHLANVSRQPGKARRAIDTADAKLKVEEPAGV